MESHVYGPERAHELAAAFFLNHAATSSAGFEGKSSDLCLDQARIRRQLIEAFTQEAVVELTFPPGHQRIFLCRLVEQDEALLSEHARENGEELCRLTGLDIAAKRTPSILISPLEPSTGNLEIMRAKRIVLRTFLGKDAYEFGSFFQGRCQVNGTLVLSLQMPVVSRALKNIRAFRVNLTSETRFPLGIMPPESDAATPSQALNISAEGIAFALPDGLKNGIHRESVVSLALQPDTSEPIVVPAVVRHRSKVRKSGQVEEFCGAQYVFPSAAVARTLERVAAEIQRRQIRHNRMFKDTSFTF